MCSVKKERSRAEQSGGEDTVPRLSSGCELTWLKVRAESLRGNLAKLSGSLRSQGNIQRGYRAHLNKDLTPKGFMMQKKKDLLAKVFNTCSYKIVSFAHVRKVGGFCFTTFLFYSCSSSS